MSYANGTTHYNLPQTVGTDKRDWFDTNEAFASVDAALHTAAETASGAASDITALSGRVGDLETASGTQAQDIVDIKADILSQGQAITRLDGEIDDVKADALDMICAVDEGTAQVATVAVSEGDYFRYNDVLYIATDDIAIGDTIVPNTNCRATNVATELQTLDGYLAKELVSLTTDGVMTLGTVFTQLWNAFSALTNESRKLKATIKVTATDASIKVFTLKRFTSSSAEFTCEHYQLTSGEGVTEIDEGYTIASVASNTFNTYIQDFVPVQGGTTPASSFSAYSEYTHVLTAGLTYKLYA